MKSILLIFITAFVISFENTPSELSGIWFIHDIATTEITSLDIKHYQLEREEHSYMHSYTRGHSAEKYSQWTFYANTVTISEKGIIKPRLDINETFQYSVQDKNYLKIWEMVKGKEKIKFKFIIKFEGQSLFLIPPE